MITDPDTPVRRLALATASRAWPVASIVSKTSASCPFVPIRPSSASDGVNADRRGPARKTQPRGHKRTGMGSKSLKRCHCFVVTMMIGLVIVTLLFLLPMPAISESPVLSGREVYDGCRNFAQKTDSELFYQGVCAGIIDDLAYYRLSLPEDMTYCPPNGISLGQAVRAVVDYMESHPGILDEDFRRIAIIALRAAWPCPDQ
jgi:Rap1a immunity proteins